MSEHERASTFTHGGATYALKIREEGGAAVGDLSCREGGRERWRETIPVTSHIEGYFPHLRWRADGARVVLRTWGEHWRGASYHQHREHVMTPARFVRTRETSS